jgi:hypothetical protein
MSEAGSKRQDMPSADPGELTTAQIFGSIRPTQLWSIIAIVCAILGTAFTLGTQSAGLLQKPAPLQHWLVVHDVVPGAPGTTGAFIRVTVRVNNVPYAYPADVAFTQIGQGMPEQSMPLPIADAYRISFEADVRVTESAPVVAARSRSTPDFEAEHLPGGTQSYEIFLVDEQSAKSLGGLTIRYSFQ